MADESIPFSKKGERKISGFVGQELLYDYVTSGLDPERAQAVEEFVKGSREAQADIQRINDGLNYVEHLSEIRVSEGLLENLKMPSSYLQVLLRKIHFDDWSPGIKMGLEVIVVALGVISLTLVLPWHKLMEINWTGNKEVVLTEVQKTAMATQDVEVSGSPEENTVVFPDEGEKIKAKDSAKTDLKELAKVATKEVAKEVPKLAQAKPSVAPPPKEEAKAAAENKLPSASAVAIAENTTPPESPKSDKTKLAAKSTKDDAGTEKRQGYLYRGTMIVTNSAAVTTKFAEKINELGGRKAGEVELGWKKGESGYFHFTMPEAKYQALLDFAKDYGGLTLQKEKHDRVMPEGIVRIIFTIDEKK